MHGQSRWFLAGLLFLPLTPPDYAIKVSQVEKADHAEWANQQNLSTEERISYIKAYYKATQPTVILSGISRVHKCL